MSNRLSAIRAFVLTAIAAVLCLSVSSCEQEGIVDTSEFALYYPGITDIGPSTNFTVAPAYHGAAPSGFSIYNVTLDGETFETECFVIDNATGELSLVGTDNLPVGKYGISISCVSAGKTFRFDNAVTVNMMKTVPDGISMEPSEITVSLDNILAGEELPSSHVVTDGGHISVKSYRIASVRKDGVLLHSWTDLFRISASGAVSIVSGNQDFLPGKYVFDFKLTTYVVGEDSEEGIYQNALTVNVTSGPLALTYSPSQGKVEAGYAMKSKAPIVKGSMDGLKFDIKSVSPKCGWIGVDTETGMITIDEGNDLVIGDRYVISMTATNKFGSRDFDEVYTVTVVDFIQPVTKFSYEAHADVIQTLPVNGKPVFDGEDLTFYFKEELPAALSELAINAETGVISAPKGNSIPVGTYNVTVVAENIKSFVETVFSFTVVENPNYFTFVRWGNNLGLAPIENYADQFRFDKKDYTYTIPVAASDIPEGIAVTFSVNKLWAQDNASIDSKTGEITVVTNRFERPMNVLRITVKVGGNDPAAISRDFYVFYQNRIKAGKYFIEFTPLVFQVNPKTGGTSAAASVTDSDGAHVESTFAMDYRGTWNFWCFDGKYPSTPQKPSDSGSFLNNLWSQYYKGIGGENASVSTGERNPISAYNTNANYRLGYYRQDDLRMVVNPDKWRDTDGNYANGIFLGETQVDNNGKTDPIVSNGTRTYVLWVWFDTKFNNE